VPTDDYLSSFPLEESLLPSLARQSVVYFSFPHPLFYRWQCLFPLIPCLLSFFCAFLLPGLEFRCNGTMCHYTKLQRQERSLSEGNVTIALHCKYSENCDIFSECRQNNSCERICVSSSAYWILVINKCMWCIIILKANNISNDPKMQLQCWQSCLWMHASLWMKIMPSLILENYH